MEDVIEERTIIKLCGYVLCSKPLNVIVRQQYHISTRSNRIYDISQRKKFCSSSCYVASNHLLAQILDTPLWLRDKEVIPVFKIFSTDSTPMQCASANKIDNCMQNITDNINDKKKFLEHNTIEQTKDVSYDISDVKNKSTHDLLNNVNIEKDMQMKEISINTDSQKIFNCETNLSKPHKNSRNKYYNTQESMKDHNDNTEKINIKSENLEVESIRQCKNILHSHEHNNAENKHSNENIRDDKSNKTSLSQPDNKNDEIKTSQSNEICSSNAIMSSNPHVKYGKKENADKINKTKSIEQKESNNVRIPDNAYIHNLVTCIEQKVREWITENTICLLLGKKDEKDELLEKFIQEEKAEKLHKKLNKLRLEHKIRNCADYKKVLKPLPDFSVLQEEGKNLEIKVPVSIFSLSKIAYKNNNYNYNYNHNYKL